MKKIFELQVLHVILMSLTILLSMEKSVQTAPALTNYSAELFNAIASNNENDVKTILATISDADLYKTNSNGETPLVKAVEGQNPAIVADILNARKTPNRPDLEYSSKQHPGQTPLFYAVNNGASNEANRTAIVQMLLDAGANIGGDPAKDVRAKRTPLHVAAQNSSNNVVQMLVNHLSNTNKNSKNNLSLVTQKDKYGRTPLAFAQESLAVLQKQRNEQATAAEQASNAAKSAQNTANQLQSAVANIDQQIVDKQAVITTLQTAMQQAS